jgi:pilus assembly protein Flp/PilA
MKKFLNRVRKDESGATAIEYGLIAALIAVVLITALGALGTNMSNQFNALSTKIANPSR